jgi:hypothetical protein
MRNARRICLVVALSPAAVAAMSSFQTRPAVVSGADLQPGALHYDVKLAVFSADPRRLVTLSEDMRV